MNDIILEEKYLGQMGNAENNYGNIFSQENVFFSKSALGITSPK